MELISARRKDIWKALRMPIKLRRGVRVTRSADNTLPSSVVCTRMSGYGQLDTLDRCTALVPRRFERARYIYNLQDCGQTLWYIPPMKYRNFRIVDTRLQSGCCKLKFKKFKTTCNHTALSQNVGIEYFLAFQIFLNRHRPFRNSFTPSSDHWPFRMENNSCNDYQALIGEHSVRDVIPPTVRNIAVKYYRSLSVQPTIERHFCAPQHVEVITSSALRSGIVIARRARGVERRRQQRRQTSRRNVESSTALQRRHSQRAAETKQERNTRLVAHRLSVTASRIRAIEITNSRRMGQTFMQPPTRSTLRDGFQDPSEVNYQYIMHPAVDHHAFHTFYHTAHPVEPNTVPEGQIFEISGHYNGMGCLRLCTEVRLKPRQN